MNTSEVLYQMYTNMMLNSRERMRMFNEIYHMDYVIFNFEKPTISVV